MQPIQEFLKEHQIEERYPYFGKARLYTLPVTFFSVNKKFLLPKEVFHFVTAIYLMDPNETHRYILHINDISRDIHPDQFSKITNEQNKRCNLLEDPVLYGNHVRISIEMVATEKIIPGDQHDQAMNLLVEYAKIDPSLYNQLHTNDTMLSSQQSGREIIQFRGHAV